MRYYVTIGEREDVVEVDGQKIVIDGESAQAELASLPGTDRRHLRLDDRSLSLFCRRQADGWIVELEGRAFLVRVEDERARHIRELASAAAPVASHREIRAPMPGLIVKVEVADGQLVTSGDGLIVIEAMKMENELRADAEGTVREVRVKPGQTVDRDDILVVLD